MGQQEATIRTIWGIAKSPELMLSNEELHLVVMAQTGKESLRKLTKKEISRVVYVLAKMKESSKSGKPQKVEVYGTATANQRRKVYKLMQELGWNEKRINGMCRRMYKIDRLEWLDYLQISNLIEALKAMIDRQGTQL